MNNLEQNEKPKITRNWTEYNAGQAVEKDLFQKLLFALCQGVEQPVQTFGRPRHALSDMVFCAVLKTYLRISGRRFTTDLREAKMRNFIERVPHYNSVFGYLENPALTPYLHELILQSSLPLKAIERDFAVDASGFRIYGTVSWFNARYGKMQDNSDWIKLSLICGTATRIVTGVHISGRHVHDSRFLKPLLTKTTENFVVEKLMADKAYSTRENIRYITKSGVSPYIDFKKNAKESGKCEVWDRAFHYYSLNREAFYDIYHARSNVESCFSVIKRRFDERIKCKTETGQINEALTKVLSYNLCVLVRSIYEFGLEPTFWAEEEPEQLVLPF